MLVDSDVLIDYLRGYKNAINWFHSLEGDVSISGYSYFELIQGTKDSNDMKKVEKFLSVFEILWLDEKEIVKALSLFKKSKFKFGMGFIDCLIGKTAVHYKKDFFTFNAKHYRAFPDLKIIKPFEK